MKVIITESQLNKILNETKWVGKSVGVKGIMNKFKSKLHWEPYYNYEI